MTTTVLQKILMAIIIFAAAWFALRYRQSNYEPPESTVTVTPPPAIQGAPSGDQPAAIAPASAPAPAPEAPMAAPAPEAPMAPMEDIGGIGSFNTIAGETMFDFDPAPTMPATPATPEAPMAPPPATPEAPMAPPAEAPPVTTGTEMYMAPPPEHSLDGEIEMYTRSGYAEI